MMEVHAFDLIVRQVLTTVYVMLGHCHLTDFSIACVMNSRNPPHAVAGTRPYMGEHIHSVDNVLRLRFCEWCLWFALVAPEVVESDSKSKGYDYAVDWWSLGVCLYELMRGKVSFTNRLY